MGRSLCEAIAEKFPDGEFSAISLNDRGRGCPAGWKNIAFDFCGWLRPAFARKALFVFKAVVRIMLRRPGLIICAHADFAPMAMAFKNMFGLKYAVMTYGVEVWPLRDGVKYRALSRADVIITISEFTKEKMVENGISPDRIDILRPAVDTYVFSPRKKDLKLAQDLSLAGKVILLTVGRMRSGERYKGYDIMLEVMKGLDDRYLWLVAGGGDDLPRIMKKAGEMGITAKVRFAGEVGGHDMSDYFNMCDIFVMPSKGEGFGIAFLEAMACGKPVIAGNRDGSREPLLGGRLGFLVDPDNADEITRAIIKASSDMEERTDPGYLRSQAEEHFGVRVFRENTARIFSRRLN